MDCIVQRAYESLLILGKPEPNHCVVWQHLGIADFKGWVGEVVDPNESIAHHVDLGPILIDVELADLGGVGEDLGFWESTSVVGEHPEYVFMEVGAEHGGSIRGDLRVVAEIIMIEGYRAMELVGEHRGEGEGDKEEKVGR